MHADDSTPRWARRAAPWFLLAHVGLIAFSTIALTTILNGPPGPWLQQEPNATVFRLGWTYSGPTYVLLGAMAALLHVAGHVGARRAITLFVVASTVALGAELLGTSTQLPFGEYHYTPILGYRILGLVPFPIPISWFYMIMGSLAMTGRLLSARDDAATKWRWALVGGAILVAWDVSMDPAMVKTAHWVWGDGDLFTRLDLPRWAIAFFTKDVFYGMPISNWFGWYLTGVIISRIMLEIVPPTRYSALLSPTWLPLALYAVNGIMPVALCVRDGLWFAAVFGAIAMMIPLGLALRAGPHGRRASALGREVAARRATTVA